MKKDAYQSNSKRRKADTNRMSSGGSCGHPLCVTFLCTPFLPGSRPISARMLRLRVDYIDLARRNSAGSAGRYRRNLDLNVDGSRNVDGYWNVGHSSGHGREKPRRRPSICITAHSHIFSLASAKSSQPYAAASSRQRHLPSPIDNAPEETRRQGRGHDVLPLITIAPRPE
ncbi:hypothetical protein C8J56DRAFT_1125006 [Mycena floridula]|nr:hypothetical protein C8J56DRAFT_1125006 [Mycena floridula]